MTTFSPTNIARLISRYLQGTITADELVVLDKWRTSSPERNKLFDELVSGNLLASNLSKLDGIDSSAAWQSLQSRLLDTPSRTRSLRRWLPYAAAAVLLLSCTVALLIRQLSLPPEVTQVTQVDIAPGTNRATLTLQDGRSITLDEARAGIVVGDQIRYVDGSELLSDVSGELSMSTPKGGTYQLTLPDGSQVWLNAASTITYPSRFIGKERVVRISGEAYFAIQPDADRPFKVISANQAVEVLGTEFNLSAYPDEDQVKTTLVRGKVKVGADQHTLVLRPGEQSTLANGILTSAVVDVGQYTAWKDGWINFDNKPFDQIMKEVERWYDIDIRYEGPVPREVGYGMASRTENLSVVLSLLEAGGFRFRLEERTLTIINQ